MGGGADPPCDKRVPKRDTAKTSPRKSSISQALELAQRLPWEVVRAAIVAPVHRRKCVEAGPRRHGTPTLTQISSQGSDPDGALPGARPAPRVVHRRGRGRGSATIRFLTLLEFVRRELEGFLRCGRLEFGFARQKCPACTFERLIGLPCRGRGFCCSCAGRRMIAGAARLVDHVIPDVPVRQWVCSLSDILPSSVCDSPWLTTTRSAHGSSPSSSPR